jgi:predicted PurR-regulated permease PerM
LVVKKVIGVPPLLVILAIIAGGQLAGVIGVILAVPIAAGIQELIHDFQQKRDSTV